MSAREDIREVIDIYTDDGCLFPDRSCNALGGGYCSSDGEAYKCLIEKLSKMGVVIKVDKEFPRNPYKWKRTFPFGEHLPQREWVGWNALAINLEYYGYTAVEPLIDVV